MDALTRHELASMQRRFSKLYRTSGVIGIRENGVQMTLVSLRHFLIDADNPPAICRGPSDSPFPVEFHYTFDGVLFYALADFESIFRLGLGESVPEELKKDYIIFADEVARDLDEQERKLEKMDRQIYIP